MQSDEIRVSVISATSGFTLGAAAHLLRRPELAQRVRLALYAPPEESDDLALVTRAIKMMAKAAGTGMPVTSTTERSAALEGADFVITAVRYGRLEAHRLDIEIPRAYGVYQVVGDTINPGGIFAALRNYALIGAIAEDMKRQSQPGAWIVNMSNPEGSICRMVAEGNGLSIVGLCPGIYGLKRYLAKYLEVPEEELIVEIAGFNHLTWVTRLELGGQDLYPRLRELNERRGPGLSNAEYSQPVSFLLLKEFGLYPSPADRHVAEFFPFFLRDDTNRGADYGLVLRDVDAMIRQRRESWQSLKARIETGNLGELYQHLGGEAMGGFQIAEVIESMQFDMGKLVQVNTANDQATTTDGGPAIEGLPKGAFVEVPAIITKGSVRPKKVGQLPLAVTSVLARFFDQQALIARAALHGDRQAIVQAMLLDPSLRHVQDAEELTDKMLEAHAPYLPMFWS